jgi:polar amino acid transport system substrate-binding protein
VRLSRRDLFRTASLFGATALAGCTTTLGGTPVPATSRPSGKPRPDELTLGVADYRPYAFKDDAGELTGEVVEVARAICDELGVALRVQVTPYDVLLPGVEAGHLDLVGGLSIREDNCARLDFTVPDHMSLTALVVPEGNPKKLSTYSEVVSTGARLAIVANSLEVGTTEAAGVRGVQTYPTTGELLRAVTEGVADCAAYDDITLRDLLTRTDGLELGPPFEPESGSPRYGFGFAKGDGLRDDFDEVLSELQNTGDWLRIAKPFGFTESNIPYTERVSDKACER